MSRPESGAGEARGTGAKGRETHRLLVAARQWRLKGADALHFPPEADLSELWEAIAGAAGLSLEELADFVAKRFYLTRVDPNNILPAGAVSASLASLEERYRVRVLDDDGRKLRVATADPLDADAHQALGFAAGRRVVFEVVQPQALLRSGGSPTGGSDLAGILDAIERADEAAIQIEVEEDPEEIAIGEISAEPIVRLADAILREAVQQNASDVHMEPVEGHGVIRYRVDGVLHPHMQLPLSAFNRLVSRYKIMTGLDIADRVRPQDGEVRIRVDGVRYELRISTVPTHDVEKAVIRIAGAAADQILDQLEIPGTELARIRRLMTHRDGMIIVTGPTGSGKTTTLYAVLHELNTGDVNIVTVEDPVERALAGATQIQVQPKRGVTFANALRAVLRQDPDIILVGEIRDLETAEISLRAAMTGHLVLTTLHTTSAVGAIPRLRDLGVDSSTLAATLRGIVGQRLARRVCGSCGGAGCQRCGGTGMRGRIPLLEVVTASPQFSQAVALGALPSELQELAIQDGMRPIDVVARDRVESGLTTRDEVLRVLGDAAGEGEKRDTGVPTPGAAVSPGSSAEPTAPFVEVPVTPVDEDQATSGGMRVVRSSDGVEPPGATAAHLGLKALEEDLARAGDLDAVLGPACVRMADLLDAPMAWGAILEGDALEVRILSDLCMRPLDDSPDDPPDPGSGLLRAALESGRPRFGKLEDQPHLGRFRECALAFGLTGFAAVPLRSGRDVVGVIGLHLVHPLLSDGPEAREAEGLAAAVGPAVERVRDLRSVGLQIEALEAAADSVLIADRKGVIGWVNRAFTQLVGYEPAEVVGRTTEFLFSERHSQEIQEEMGRTVLAGRSWRGEVHLRRKDGTDVLIEQMVTPAMEEGEPTKFIAVHREALTGLDREHSRARLLTRDTETGLPNAKEFLDRVRQSIEGAREGLRSTLLMVRVHRESPGEPETSVDAWKGRIRGAGVLLRRILRPGDFLARIGEDEFAAILTGTGREGARIAAMRIHEAARSPEGGLRPLALSLGMAVIDGTRTARGVLALAEAEIYPVPDGSQRGPVSVEAKAWTERIRRALEGGLFTLHFQPVVRLSSGGISHSSSVVRILEEDGTVIPARAFIGHAEEVGLIVELDRWVLDHALQLLGESPELRLSINLSWKTMGDNGFREDLLGRRAELEPLSPRLILEIPTPESVHQVLTYAGWIDELVSLGFRFAMDNANVDREAVTGLGALPVHWVKLDGSLIRGIDADPVRQELVHSFVEVAQALGREVIAVRAETEEVVALLPRLGVDLAEGHTVGQSGGWSDRTAERVSGYGGAGSGWFGGAGDLEAAEMIGLRG